MLKEPVRITAVSKHIQVPFLKSHSMMKTTSTIVQEDSISSTNSFSIDCELNLSCLKAFVRWHLEKDSTPLSPTLDNLSGKFLALPFQIWWDCDDAKGFEADFAEWRALGYAPSERVLRCIGSELMTESMKQRLIGPSIPDQTVEKVIFKRGQCKWGSEYWQVDATEEQLQDIEFERASYKGMIACIVQWYLNKYLCSGYDSVACLYEPRSSGYNRPKHLKLALGVFRELLVLPRFETVTKFWQVHARMVEEGGKLIGFWREGEGWGVMRVREVLEEDPDALKMLELLLDLGFIQGRCFTSEYGLLGMEFKTE